MVDVSAFLPLFLPQLLLCGVHVHRTSSASGQPPEFWLRLRFLARFCLTSVWMAYLNLGFCALSTGQSEKGRVLNSFALLVATVVRNQVWVCRLVTFAFME